MLSPYLLPNTILFGLLFLIAVVLSCNRFLRYLYPPTPLHTKLLFLMPPQMCEQELSLRASILQALYPQEHFLLSLILPILLYFFFFLHLFDMVLLSWFTVNRNFSFLLSKTDAAFSKKFCCHR